VLAKETHHFKCYLVMPKILERAYSHWFQLMSLTGIMLLPLGWMQGILSPDGCLDATMANRGFGLGLFLVRNGFLAGWVEKGMEGCRDSWCHLQGMGQELATMG